jgi:hypothetical protein
MVDILSLHEPLIRLMAFAGVFALMAACEIFAPRRGQKIGRSRRWPSNIGVVALDTLLVRLLFPVTAIGLALLVEAKGWGLFAALDPPAWLAIVLGVVEVFHGTNAGRIDVSAIEVRAPYVGACQVGTSKLDAPEIGPNENGVPQRSILH